MLVNITDLAQFTGISLIYIPLPPPTPGERVLNAKQREMLGEFGGLWFDIDPSALPLVLEIQEGTGTTSFHLYPNENGGIHFVAASFEVRTEELGNRFVLWVHKNSYWERE